MALYRRGKVWWFKFRFEGQVIRESAKTESKTVARDAERARRRDLELAVNRIRKRERMPLFSVAALQRKRVAEGKAGRTVNYEIGVLRQILRARGLWGALSDRVKSLREAHDAGRSISRTDETELVHAAAECRSPAMLPLLILSIDTGLRASEVRALCRRDLTLEWRRGVIVSGRLVVPKSKTDAGTGRIVPFTRRVCAALTLWLSRFPDAERDSYVFPRHKVGLSGNGRAAVIFDVQLDRPIGEWKTAWERVREKAGVDYRWHDLRHTFVTRLAENPNVSEETIRSLAGHVSRRMLERCSHIRTRAKEEAIRALEQPELPGDETQIWAQPSDRTLAN